MHLSRKNLSCWSAWLERLNKFVKELSLRLPLETSRHLAPANYYSNTPFSQFAGESLANPRSRSLDTTNVDASSRESVADHSWVKDMNPSRLSFDCYDETLGPGHRRETPTCPDAVRFGLAGRSADYRGISGYEAARND